MSVRALALALAVGLGGLLVGLSVAPRLLPGDTIRVEVRDISGATLEIKPLSSGPGDVSIGDHAPAFIAGLIAIMLAPLEFHLAGPPIFTSRTLCRRLAGSTLTAAGSRGPPLSS